MLFCNAIVLYINIKRLWLYIVIILSGLPSTWLRPTPPTPPSTSGCLLHWSFRWMKCWHYIIYLHTPQKHLSTHINNEETRKKGAVLIPNWLFSPHGACSIPCSNSFDSIIKGKSVFLWISTTHAAFFPFQALVFYLPRKLWKSFEGGLMESFGEYSSIYEEEISTVWLY